MKLDDAVYLVAPKPATSTMPTRRAFVFAGTTFALGVSVGGACVYAAAASANEKPLAVDEVIPPSGDADLDELRRLAVKAPIEELVDRRRNFVESTRSDYRTDPVLWRGIERLTKAVIADKTLADRRVFVRVLAQLIEHGDPALTKSVLPMVSELRAIK